MDLSKLKMTLSAYNKVSPSILSDYPTREELINTLKGYVEEAPDDNNIYARMNKAWVALSNAIIDNDGMLFWGTNTIPQITQESEVLSLQHNMQIPLSTTNINIEVEMPKQEEEQPDTYCWIVCTKPITAVEWGMGSIDISKNNVTIDGKINENNVTLYGYRIDDLALGDNYTFTVKF